MKDDDKFELLRFYKINVKCVAFQKNKSTIMSRVLVIVDLYT